MIVMKFGGTSVGDAKIIKEVAEIIKSKLSQKPVIVVSAVKTVTNLLIDLAQKSAEGDIDAVFRQIEKVHMGIINGLGLEKSILDKDLASLSGNCLTSMKLWALLRKPQHRILAN